MTPGGIQSPEAEAMDRYNNEIGIGIGRAAKSWSDVISRSQEVMDQSHRSGDGRNGGAQWLPESEWHKNPINEKTNQPAPWNWPQTDWTGGEVREKYDYPFGEDKSDGINMLDGGWLYLDSPADQPPVDKPRVSEEDANKLMASDAYWQNWHPYYNAVHLVVDQYFEDAYGNNNDMVGETEDDAATDDGESGDGGMIHVRSYLRNGGQVSVRDYDRSRPHRGQ